MFSGEIIRRQTMYVEDIEEFVGQVGQFPSGRVLELAKCLLVMSEIVGTILYFGPERFSFFDVYLAQ